MKASFKCYIFLQLIFILFGCQGDRVKDATKGANSFATDTAKKALLAAPCGLHKINWDTLLAYTHNMVLDPSLRNMVNKESFGGIFSVSTLKSLVAIKKDVKMDGFAGWWCWDQQGTVCPERLFIALEPIAKYDTEILPNYPTVGPLYISQGVFEYPDIVLSHEDYIKNHTELPNGPDLGVDLNRIKGFIDEFRTNFPYRMPGGSNYNQYANAFFMDMQGCKTLSEFLDQFGTYKFPYVRYYFGLNKGNKSNKLRLILVPVDAHGKNIHTNGNQQAHYLQHTFP